MDQQLLAIVISSIALAGVLAKTLQEALRRRNGGDMSAGARREFDEIGKKIDGLGAEIRRLDNDVNHPDGWLRRKHHDEPTKLMADVARAVDLALAETRRAARNPELR